MHQTLHIQQFESSKFLRLHLLGKIQTKLKKAFDPIGYNYWDYVQAWTHVFWKQNKAGKHSWLIYFKHGVNYTFLNWFLQWWDYFGPIQQIFPLKV